MVGGDAEHVAVQPVFDALKPAGEGFVHAGPVGAGHFTKMVHNGIEYGSCRPTPRATSCWRPSDLVDDVPGVIAVLAAGHRHPVLAARPAGPGARGGPGPGRDPRLRRGLRRGPVDRRGAIEHAVPLPVITAALFARFASRQDDSPAMKVVAALRNQFGGHAVERGRPEPPAVPKPAGHVGRP